MRGAATEDIAATPHAAGTLQDQDARLPLLRRLLLPSALADCGLVPCFPGLRELRLTGQYGGRHEPSELAPIVQQLPSLSCLYTHVGPGCAPFREVFVPAAPAAEGEPPAADALPAAGAPPAAGVPPAVGARPCGIQVLCLSLWWLGGRDLETLLAGVSEMLPGLRELALHAPRLSLIEWGRDRQAPVLDMSEIAVGHLCSLRQLRVLLVESSIGVSASQLDRVLESCVHLTSLQQMHLVPHQPFAEGVLWDGVSAHQARRLAAGRDVIIRLRQFNAPRYSDGIQQAFKVGDDGLGWYGSL
jgi:hypothetical protein